MSIRASGAYAEVRKTFSKPGRVDEADESERCARKDQPTSYR